MTKLSNGTGIVRSLLGAVAVMAPLTMSGAARADMAQIPIIVKDTTSGYWQTVLAGARKAGKELGIKVPELGAQSESDVSGQIATLEKAAAEKPLAIVIAPTQFTPLGKPIDAAAKSVKIVGIDSSADSKAFSSFLTTDNVQGGRIAADQLAEGIKAKTGKIEGDVALITPIAGAGSLDQRAAGFKEELAKYPGLKLTAEKTADGKMATGQAMMVDLMASDPKLVGIFASNQVMTMGIGRAVGEADAGAKITVVGFDSDVRLVKMLTSGAVYALIIQDPFRMGYDGVKTAFALSKGESAPTMVDTGVVAVTKANMDSPRSKEMLNPKLD